MRPEKKAIVEQIREEVDAGSYVIMTDYKGLTVSQTEELRAKLFDVQAKLRIVKNRMFRHVAQELSPDLVPQLTGPTALVVGDGDVVDAAKVLKDFIKSHKLPTLKAGVLGPSVLSTADVEALADLPPKPQMQAMLLGTLAAPMTQLVGVMQQKLSSLVYVLKAIEDKKTGE
jgi:large subunit ribosomal protein L10